MHGVLFRGTNTTNTKPSGVHSMKEGGNVVKTAHGFRIMENVADQYKENPFFKGDADNIDETMKKDAHTELLKTVPDDRQVGNAEGYESVGYESINNPMTGYVKRKETLDDLYKDNPYYKPATT